MNPTQTRSGITMHNCVKIAHDLAVGEARESYEYAPISRLFVPSLQKGAFRGYVTPWHTAKRGDCFRACVFFDDKRATRLTKTAKGARGAMIRMALKMMPRCDLLKAHYDPRNPKIDLFDKDGRYIASTNFHKTCRDALAWYATERPQMGVATARRSAKR